MNNKRIEGQKLIDFTRKLRRIPKEPVGLYQSGLGLAFTDISQVWKEASAFGDRTVPVGKPAFCGAV